MVFRDYFQPYDNCQDISALSTTNPHYRPYHKVVTAVIIGASDLWQGTRAGAPPPSIKLI